MPTITISGDGYCGGLYDLLEYLLYRLYGSYLCLGCGNFGELKAQYCFSLPTIEKDPALSGISIAAPISVSEKALKNSVSF